MDSASWRLIDTGSLPGAENMAIDETLLSSFRPPVSIPTLRVYGWEPTTISLGRFQKSDDVLDLEKCRRDGVPIVRRISGGGVIYHAEELTYSLVCAPEHLSAAASVKDGFRALTGFLLEFYRRLGLQPGYAVDLAPTGSKLGERTPFCFAGRETFDIVIGGKKIGGNAQRRTRGVIFQHGSIPLVDHAETGLSYMRDRSPALAQGAGSLKDLGVTAKRGELLMVLRQSFESALGVTLTQSKLNERETEVYRHLMVSKYSRDAWNLHGELE